MLQNERGALPNWHAEPLCELHTGTQKTDIEGAIERCYRIFGGRHEPAERTSGTVFEDTHLPLQEPVSACRYLIIRLDAEPLRRIGMEQDEQTQEHPNPTGPGQKWRAAQTFHDNSSFTL